MQVGRSEWKSARFKLCRSVCAGVRQRAPGGSVSRMSMRSTLRRGGSGRRHQRQAALTKHALAAAGLPVLDNHSHIVPLMVNDADLCKKASDMLLDRHSIYIQPINYPTVAKGTERLRITPTPRHTDEQIAELVEALVDVWKTLKLPFNTAEIVPLRRPALGIDHCTYVDMKRAAE